jgi:hypothetical protein
MYEDLSPEQECPFCISVLAETMQHRHRRRCKQLREFTLLHRGRSASIIVARRAFNTFSPVTLGRANGGMAPFLSRCPL